MTTQPPSGEQFAIAFGDQRAVVVEAGGGIRSYSVAGRDVIDGYAEDEMCSSGRGQLLLPWPNRIRDGRYEFAGKTHQLSLTEVARHNASHGLVRWASFRLLDRSESHVSLGYRVAAQPGYPFVLDVAITYRLDAAGLTVELETTNAGREACPFGSGAHPYFRLSDGLVDSLELTLPASTVLQIDDRGIPVDPMPVDGTPLDFRPPRRIGDLKLDHAYTGLVADADGKTRVRLSDPDSGRRIEVWCDAAYGYLQLFTGDTAATKPRRGLAIEPMTCAPDAFNTGEGLLVLQPGETTRSTWGVSTFATG